MDDAAPPLKGGDAAPPLMDDNPAPPLQILQLERVDPAVKAYVALFRDVENAADIHDQLVTKTAEYDYAFIDASVILSQTQLYSVVFRAVYVCTARFPVTGNVHSEIILSMAPTNSVMGAYCKFGISPTTTNLLVVRITSPTPQCSVPPTAEELGAHLATIVDGERVEYSDDELGLMTDWAKVQASYGLDATPDWLESAPDAEKRAYAEATILGGMAMRQL